MQSVCRICKIEFKSEIQESLCLSCKTAILRCITEDPKLKLEFLEKVMQDQICIERIAKAIFNVPARTLGIGGPGSLAEFFRKEDEVCS
jgi:hypothetical protein